MRNGQYNNNPIEVVSFYKYLGVFFTTCLKWTKTCDAKASQGNKVVCVITGARNQISHMPLTTHGASFVYNINKRGTMGSKGHMGNLITSACGVIKRFLSQNKQVSLKQSFLLFDVMMKPILLHGSEIWGYQRRKCVESVQIQFCKFLLKLGSHTSNDASLGECGRYNLYVDSLFKCIKF